MCVCVCVCVCARARARGGEGRGGGGGGVRVRGEYIPNVFLFWFVGLTLSGSSRVSLVLALDYADYETGDVCI